MKNKKIIIAGGSGFIGQAIARYFGKDNEIIILGRQTGDKHKNSSDPSLLPEHEEYKITYVKWNGIDIEQNWSDKIDGADLVINLAGKSVNCRYHKKQKQEIFDSRTTSTTAIGKAIAIAKNPPFVWINAASTTIYRHSTDSPNNEVTGLISDRKKDNMPYNFIDELRYKKNRLLARLIHSKKSTSYSDLDLDFSVQVCKRWEAAFLETATPDTRKIILRTAITLGRGGVITPYLTLCKFGLGGKHGNGRQFFSWIHIRDLCRMIDWLFYNDKAEGVYNCVAPNAVSNYSFMKTLRQVTGCRIGLPAPAWLLEAGAFLIGTETELMLKSRWAVPGRALAEGFVFEYPLLKEAIEEIVSQLPHRDYRLY